LSSRGCRLWQPKLARFTGEVREGDLYREYLAHGMGGDGCQMRQHLDLRVPQLQVMQTRAPESG
jgi:hypothetical protein